jgi:hypothetical protein
MDKMSLCPNLHEPNVILPRHTSTMCCHLVKDTEGRGLLDKTIGPKNNHLSFSRRLSFAPSMHTASNLCEKPLPKYYHWPTVRRSEDFHSLDKKKLRGLIP